MYELSIVDMNSLKGLNIRVLAPEVDLRSACTPTVCEMRRCLHVADACAFDRRHIGNGVTTRLHPPLSLIQICPIPALPSFSVILSVETTLVPLAMPIGDFENLHSYPHSCLGLISPPEPPSGSLTIHPLLILIPLSPR
jgi:hypothetical protein